MGIFSAPCQLTKQDWFNPKASKTVSFDALVDTGCTQLVINEAIASALGYDLEDGIETSATLASGNQQTAVKFEGLKLVLCGLQTTINVVVIRGENVKPLLGAIPLEDLNLMVIPAEKRLAPIPGTIEAKLFVWDL